METVEFANVVVLNKTDLVTEEQLTQLEDIIHALNPDAKIIKARSSSIIIKSLSTCRCLPSLFCVAVLVLACEPG